MALYSENINTSLYKYVKPVYITETSGANRNLVPIKLSLNSSNFNFDLARNDGLDIRIAERSNGTGVYLMWIAYWDISDAVGTIWFKLPSLLAAETKEVWLFWGNTTDSGISNVYSLVDSDSVFLFADGFDDPVLSGTRWIDSSGTYTLDESYIHIGLDSWIESSVNSGGFILEEGVTGIGSPTSTTNYAHRVQFLGGENPFEIRYFWEGSTDRQHNFRAGGSVQTYNDTERGLEIGSYAQLHVAYWEGTDRVYQGMINRNTYQDYEDSWERAVHRNTEVNSFRVWGHDLATSDGLKIDWIIAREYNPDNEPVIDLSNLYEEYEYVAHQQLDYREYGTDITNTSFYHSSDMGGDPYNMSDNAATDLLGAFVSSDGTTQGSIIIDFGRSSAPENSKNYLHLDDGHVDYYTAAKLSDLDTDVYGNTYWLSNKTSGWVAIKFPSRITIASFKVHGVSSNLSGMVKNYNFYGSNKDPRFSGWTEKVLLHTGIFLQQSQEQLVYLSNRSSYFYYILEVVDTYGGNIALQEWAMYRRIQYLGKKVVAQLRLKPVTDGINEYYFPKQIKLEASNDLINWTTLLNTVDTPTPFTNYVYGRWSRYSFENYDGYYIYRLTCYDNWRAAEDIIKISEWEMVERIEEETVYRILGGSTSNINSIWADDSANYDSGHFYIVNDKLNTIKVNELVEVSTISGTISDINVKGS